MRWHTLTRRRLDAQAPNINLNDVRAEIVALMKAADEKEADEALLALARKVNQL